MRKGPISCPKEGEYRQILRETLYEKKRIYSLNYYQGCWRKSDGEKNY